MPFVTVKMLSGRTQKQKKQLVRGVTKAVAKALEIDEGSVWLVIEEVEREHWSIGGELLSERK